MDKDTFPVANVTGGGGGGGVYPVFPPPSNRFPTVGSSSSSISRAISDQQQLSHDISQMPDYPPRNNGHRRSQSEILSLPDDISFDVDLGFLGSGDGPSLSDETEEDLMSMYLDMEKFASSSSSMAEASVSASDVRPRVRHQHSQSMDGSTSIKPEMLTSGGEGSSSLETKKAMSAAKLADLALIDPKRAKRIWANRQSAARSKERKMRYIAELERKVQTLQTEATTLSAQLTMLQGDANGLNAENSELKLRVQSMEQQVHLQDALNDALREEVQRLKLATGPAMMNLLPPPFGGNQQHFYQQNPAMQSVLAAHQLKQLQIASQHQLRPQQQQYQQQQQQPAAVDPKWKGSMAASQVQREGTSQNCTPKE